MSIESIVAANGAQLLSQFEQSTGQAQGAGAAAENAALKAMKTAIAEAQMSESEIVNSGGNGHSLNVYA